MFLHRIGLALMGAIGFKCMDESVGAVFDMGSLERTMMQDVRTILRLPSPAYVQAITIGVAECGQQGLEVVRAKCNSLGVQIVSDHLAITLRGRLKRGIDIDGTQVFVTYNFSTPQEWLMLTSRTGVVQRVEGARNTFFIQFDGSYLRNPLVGKRMDFSSQGITYEQ